MKKIILGSLVVFLFSSGCDTTQHILNGLPTGTDNSVSQVAAGLKEALSIGAQNSTNRLSAVNGFFSNAALKILMPPEAQKVESTLRSIGLGSLVDKAIQSMNRGAEEASKSALPIFSNAIKQMTINDAMGILKGGDFAATNYFKEKTSGPLTEAFRPVIESSLQKVEATRYWNDVFSAYNKVARTPVNTDLSAYVTEKALAGIFLELSLEEQKIRKDPAARVTELLKKVFAQQ
ncbi:DUF4197 domain-containing protein [Flavihumibacter sp. CACIAM 22H1]|uniref:DUF4197 domain-containing protein n=1 Tax=Flavihumibacter sp. CACIAM 22H1 TaxID=1812911 RepID=UPI0007A80796|nr:DUF4197 domain-containing protein [Flavihumibacter sp. CACIAM 22H1]KYP13744.1 MAG: hypothetical protein A1D16_18915 [Flavihumibacter sp. CACIAM 22H1]